MRLLFKSEEFTRNIRVEWFSEPRLKDFRQPRPESFSQFFSICSWLVGGYSAKFNLKVDCTKVIEVMSKSLLEFCPETILENCSNQKDSSHDILKGQMLALYSGPFRK